MQSGPLIPFVLPSQVFSASGNFNVPLDTLPKRINNGLIAHVASFLFALPLAPTYSSGVGTLVGDNKAVNNIPLYDGVAQRFQGNFNDMRNAERMQIGKTVFPDETYAASASTRAIVREFTFGPRNFIASPTDFIVPCSILIGSSIQGTWGALADIDANCTAASGTMRVIAMIYGLDNELRIPAVYEVRSYNAGAPDIQLPGTYAYDFIAMYKSTYAAFSAGDVGNVTLDFGTGTLLQAVKAVDLSYMFNIAKNAGINGFIGEPEAASAVNQRRVNPTTPTALTDAENNLQPIWWSPLACKQSKLTVSAGTARLQWGGSLTTAQILTGRFLPANSQSQEIYVQRALANLQNMRTTTFGIKTLKGKEFKGDMKPFMSLTFKLAQK